MITVRTSRRPLNICNLDGRLRKARLQKFVSRKTSRISKVKVCGGGGVRSWMGDQPRIGLSTSWSATFLATSRIPSNFFRFEQLFAFWAICLVISNSEISKQLLVLKLAFFHIAQCFSRQFMNLRTRSDFEKHLTIKNCDTITTLQFFNQLLLFFFSIYRPKITNLFWLDNDVQLTSKRRRFLAIF